MLSTLTKTILGISLLTALLPAQEPPGKKIPVGDHVACTGRHRHSRQTQHRGTAISRDSSGFHVNSNKPSAEYLIPTVAQTRRAHRHRVWAAPLIPRARR